MASSLKHLPRIFPRAIRPATTSTSSSTSSSSTAVCSSRTLPPTPRILQTQAQAQHVPSLKPTRRTFTTTAPQARAKTMGQLRARNSTGPFSWKAALLFVITGGGMIVYFQVEKERLARKRVAEMSKGVGRPKVGGPFVLKDLEGKEITEEALKGKYAFVRHFRQGPL